MTVVLHLSTLRNVEFRFNRRSIDSSDNVVLQLVPAIKYVSHKFRNDASHIHQPCSKIEILDYSIALKESETVCSVTFPTAPNCVPLRRFTPIDSRLVSLVPVVAGSDRSTQGTILVPNVLRGSSMPRGQFLTQLLRDLCCHEDGHGTHGRGRMVRYINCISFNDYHLSTNSFLYASAKVFNALRLRLRLTCDKNHLYVRIINNYRLEYIVRQPNSSSRKKSRNLTLSTPIQSNLYSSGCYNAEN